MTALQLNICLNGIHRLLITKKVRSAFPAQTNAKVKWKLLSQYQYALLSQCTVDHGRNPHIMCGVCGL